MHCPTLQDLPPPPTGKTGWPWTEESPGAPSIPCPDGDAWPKVSIVTPSFNQGAYIERTIRSVLLQGYPQLDYIIIDGGSKDDSVTIIRKYEKWLTFWASEPDEGATQACNKGFTKATGKVFGLMCADDYFAKEGILRLAELRQTYQTSVAWAGSCLVCDDAGNVVERMTPFMRDPEAIGDWGVGSCIPGISCFFDAGTFRRLGCFDERFKSASDLELWVRLTRVGAFSLCNDIVAVARYDANSISRRDWPGEVAARIALNYVNGQHDTAKTILSRYAADIARRPADNVLRAIGPRRLSIAFARSLLDAVRKRLAHAVRPH